MGEYTGDSISPRNRRPQGSGSKGKNPGFCRFKPTGRGAWKDGRVRGGGGGAEGEGGYMRGASNRGGHPTAQIVGGRGLVGSQNFEEKPDWSPTKKTLHY